MGNRAKVAAIFPSIEQTGSLAGSRRLVIQFQGYERHYQVNQQNRAESTTSPAPQLSVMDAATAVLARFAQGHPQQITFSGGEPLVYADWIKRLLTQLPNCQVQVKSKGLLTKSLAELLPFATCFSLHWDVARLDKLLAAKQDINRTLQLLCLRQGELILHLSTALLADEAWLAQQMDSLRTLCAAAQSLPIWLVLPAAERHNACDDLKALAPCLAVFPLARIIRPPADSSCPKSSGECGK